MSHIYCPECGFQSPEAANFCSRCGALVARDVRDETTQSIDPGEMTVEDVFELASGPTLVVRAGGGRVGERFVPALGKTLIGRSPDCDIFLDDVTVSRRHAEVTRDERTISIRDLGSLNGTFVNRRRIETAKLEDDDEVQIGKYRLTYLER
ncbi:MAG: FHA domain-containing protein [Actinobacteria bacterium]|nr:FHA domain-containing protein [Actinomycetota bacterium]